VYRRQSLVAPAQNAQGIGGYDPPGGRRERVGGFPPGADGKTGAVFLAGQTVKVGAGRQVSVDQT